jgi:dynein heavy chain
MISKNARVTWMISMLQGCFGKTPEDITRIKDDDDLVKTLEKFLAGKLGQTLLVYYQKPYKLNERNEKVEYSTYSLSYNQGKSVELRNRAAFFQRMLHEGKEFTTDQLQTASDNHLIFGEVTSDTIIGMNKIIYNYVYQQIDDTEWGENIELEQKGEFKKMLESFAKDLNDTVESLIKGVKYAEVPQECKDFILKDNSKEYIPEENSKNLIKKLEDIYQSWIDKLSEEVEDADNKNPIAEDLGPKSELEKWKYRLQRLTKANDFFKSSDYKIVQRYFSEPKMKQQSRIQTLINDLKQKRIESHTAQSEAKDNMKYLQTLEVYFNPLYVGTPDTIIDSLQSLMNSLKLISFTARYYDNTKMTNLFSRVTDQMINNCKDYILDKKQNFTNEDPTYIWSQHPSDLINKFQSCTRLFVVYKEKYKEAKTNTTSTNKENKFEFSEHQLFGKFDHFCKRLNKLIELFTTIKQFEDIKRHKIDSMEVIVMKYDTQLENFKSKTSRLLDFQNTKFDKDYVAFNLSISDIESNLHDIINDEFKNIDWIEKKLKLLNKYDSIFSKKNLKEFLKNVKIEIYSNYKNEIDDVQKNFEAGRTSPKVQRNMPTISGKIKWAKHLFNRIYPFINSFSDISIKERSETELSYMTTNTLLYTYIMLNENFFEKFVESAKSKLSAPLLVINENTGPKVNLDLYVLQLIREAKCMIRMNCNIPETARIILLQEDRFKRYYNELTFLIKEHKRILSRIGKNEAENYFKAHIKDLNIKLLPLKTTVNWSSMNIDTSLAAVFSCLTKFEQAIDAFYEILENRVHRNMMSIRKLDLLHIKDKPLNFNFNEIIKEQEEKVKLDNASLLSKSKEIEVAITDIITGIKSYPLDPKVTPVEDKILYKLMFDYEEKFYEFLTTTTKNSLLSLKDKISVLDEKITDKSLQGIFRVNVTLLGNMIEIEPRPTVIQDAINKLAKSILFAMKGITSWKTPDSDEVISFHTKIGKDTEIVKIIFLLTGSVKKCCDDIEQYLKNTFDNYKHLWTDSIEKKIKEFTTRKERNGFGYEEKLKTYTSYEEKLKEYTSIEKQINNMSDDITIGSITLNMVKIKANLKQQCSNWKNAYSKELLRTTRGCAKELNELINGFDKKLKKKPEKVDELKETVDTLQEIRAKEGEIEMQIKPFVQFSNLLKEHTKPADFENYRFMSKEDFERNWEKVLKRAGQLRDELDNEQLVFKRRLFQEKNKLEELIRELKRDYELTGPTKARSPEDAFDTITRFRNKTEFLKKTAKMIEHGEIIFNYPVSDYPQLKEIELDLKTYGTLYDLYNNILRQREAWKDLYWNEVHALREDMEQKVVDFENAKGKVAKRLVGTPEYVSLTELINETSKTVEAFKQLDFPNYEPVHWEKIAEILKVPEAANVKSEGGGLFKLKLLFDAEIHNFLLDLEEVNSYGVQQEKVKTTLSAMESQLKLCDFEFKQHPKRKDVQLFDQTFDDKKQEIEDNSGRIASFKPLASKLTPDLVGRIKAKELQFSNTLSTMETWIQVQNQWNNLQSFFIGGEIKKELPGPAKLFEGADKEFVKLMERAYGVKNIMTLCSSNEIQPILKNEIESKLKECQRKLDEYLESKRTEFPRFYFCSNSVLLDILSKGSDPGSIRTNINIIFDAITDLDFDEVDKKTITKIMQTKSASNKNDKQEVLLKQFAVKCEGKIEVWLNTLVSSMQLSLKKLFEECYLEVRQFFDGKLSDNRDSFENFISKYICQVSLFGLQILGTKKLEEFVKRTYSDKPETYKKKIIEGTEQDPTKNDFDVIQLALQSLCRKDHSKNKLEIVKLETLVIIHVHNRDIFDFILKHKDSRISLTDYDWLKQTRVYWDIQGIKTCIINITDVPFEYGYEFLGAKERMCITKLTDKCYITLAQAMGMNYGGAPAGPAGTGKTETVKDMGRSMGVFVLVTNCGPDHKFHDMALIFKGLCKAGAWGCFDEFNRIYLDVLSVLAMIVSAIQECRRTGKGTFYFPDTSIGSNNDLCKLEGTTAYFITMNPTYAGRQQLPENLKVLFRGVTMMLPDREAIIRVKLSSYGFDNNEDLSKKFKKLYDLCEAQLSKQTHYDFGLRNILAVLRHAGNEKKKEQAAEKEEELIYVALRDMNESKLVPDDIDLFKSLLEDVFPNQRKVAQKVYPKLESKIKEIMRKRNLDDSNNGWIKKIIQTFETSVVRHGFILVGPTGSGKTTILEILKDALEETDAPQKWKIHRLNPKAVEKEFLFIETLKTEWIRGVFTQVWRRCNESTSPDSKKNNWLVCDGPIDTTWIESLNTVLDDNKILTLSNNDRIPMLDSCRCVFECENVKNASLATVSRNGMIYITEDNITIPPLFVSWFMKNGKTFFKDLNKSKEQELKDLIMNKYFTKDFILQINVVTKFAQVMNVSWLIRVKNFMLLIEAILQDITSQSKKEFEKGFLEKVVIFSLVWSIGSLYENDQRKAFHKLLEQYGAQIPPISGDRTIFEYRIDGNTWIPWATENDDAINLKAEIQNFSQLLVPTMDSTRAIYLMDLIARVKIDENSDRTHPSLVLGDTGTAKTSTILLYNKLILSKSFILKRINFSSATTTTNFQNNMDDDLTKGTGNEFNPTSDKNLVVFIDDLSMPYVDVWGDQYTLELVRQLLELSGYYLIGRQDDRGTLIKINRVQFIAAMNHPKNGKNNIPNRLKRQFFIFNMVLPNEQSVNDIYGKILELWFTPKAFGENIARQATKLTKLTSDFLDIVKKNFQPTPVKFHYNYNMRELSRTFQGIFMADKDCIKTSNKLYGIDPEIFLIVLWKHEATRVFCDKLRDVHDIEKCKGLLDELLSEEMPNHMEVLRKEHLFCNHLRQLDPEVSPFWPENYEKISSMAELKTITEDFQKNMNSNPKIKSVSLVLFEDCLKYLIKITRILRTKQGSAMLVGVGGSGKQSLTRLAAYICQQVVKQLTPDRADKVDELKGEFRNIYTDMIKDFNPNTNKDIVKHTFLMTDAELKLDSFLETISSFLATGEIANLYPKKDEKNDILSLARNMLIKMSAANQELDDNAIWIKFIAIIRDCLHMSLCLSPSSDKFRQKYIKFPVLFNNCTIIWLLSWPEDALISVAKDAMVNDPNLKLVANENQVNELCKHMAGVHLGIDDVCRQYDMQMKKKVYVTPKSYLTYIDEYIKLYKVKRDEIVNRESIIQNGLGKLDQAAKDIEKQNIELEAMMKQLDQNKRIVEEKRNGLLVENEKIAILEAEVSAKETECMQKKESIEAEKTIVQAELENALPILEKAKKAMEAVTPEVIRGIQALRPEPPSALKFFIECTHIIFGKRLLPQTEFGTIPRKADNQENWPGFPASWRDFVSPFLATGTLKEITRYQYLITKNNLNINDETLELIRPYIEAKLNTGEYLFANAVKIGGESAGILGDFCTLLKEYVIAVRDVKPKQLALDVTEKQLEAAMTELKAQQDMKAEVLENQAKLAESLKAAQQELDIQEEQANAMLKKLEAAKNLINSLSGEKIKWREDSKRFKQQKEQLLGDLSICSGFLAYCGPFNFKFREMISNNSLKSDIINRRIPFTDDVEVVSFLVDNKTQSEWMMNKLPSDLVSLQNATLVTMSSRYPLLIDPQNQARTWLLTTFPEIETEKHIYQQKYLLDGNKFDIHFKPRLEAGDQIIIEGIENEVDSKFDPVLEKQLIGTSKKKKIRLGDGDIEFNERFKMYLLCKLISPHFTPELAAKTTIIDFCVTAVGLEQQLQGIVISQELPIVEESLKNCLIEITNNQNALEQCQKDILSNLNQEGSLLENENIVVVLNASKTKSDEIGRKNKEVKEKKEDINAKREKYLPVATRGSVLYFSIVGMQEISKMYSTSLQQFINLFISSIKESTPSSDIKSRVRNITKKLTETVYKYVVRGLFERDKITFVLTVCFKILTTERIDGTILLDENDINRFIRAGGTMNILNERECPYDVLCAKGDKKTKEWMNLLALQQHKFNRTQQVFAKILDKIADNYEKFKNWYNSPEPENNLPFDDIYNPYNEKLQFFLKLMFVRSLREDRTLIYVIQTFVGKILDDEDFLRPISEGIKDILELSRNTIPVLYLLSAGADPSADIKMLAEKKGKKIISISMGEGQEVVASHHVNEARDTGNWVLLENCHLGLKYMSDLDTLLKSDVTWHEDTRIWLSCSPEENFPIGLLHQSLKVTNEPPKGIMAGMIKTFSSVVDQNMIDEHDIKEWRHLVFTLTFMHSLVIERRKYGPLGWCNPYDFNNSDLQASIQFVDKQFKKGFEINDKELPSNMINFKTLCSVVSVILYGGRIFDLKDGELFEIIAATYLEESLFTKPNSYCFYPSSKDKSVTTKGGPEYRLPHGDIAQIDKFIEHIRVFPKFDPPQVFGLHASADLTFRIKEFNELLQTMTSTLPKDGSGGGGSTDDDELKQRVQNFIKIHPKDFIEDEYRPKIKNLQYGGYTGLEVPLHNVLLQEIITIQEINIIVRKSLEALSMALDGTLIMTDDILQVKNAMIELRPPRIWTHDSSSNEISWLSGSVASWHKGLLDRNERLREWLNCESGVRPAFWLPGFINPQGFFAAFKQEVYKQKKGTTQNLTLDLISLKFMPDRTEIDPEKYKLSNKKKFADKNNMLVYGLYIEGCGWNGYLQDESNDSRNTIIMFPVINVIGDVDNTKGTTTLASNQPYMCPLYKYPRRTDTYFVIEIELTVKSDTDWKFWKKRGVALLCNKD